MDIIRHKDSIIIKVAREPNIFLFRTIFGEILEQFRYNMLPFNMLACEWIVFRPNK